MSFDNRKITATIDGNHVEVSKGTTILDAAKLIGIKIPTLCYHPFLSTEGACRICVVEVEGMRNFPPACATTLAEGMVVHTQNNKIRKARRDIVELLLDNHPKNCLTCTKGGNCELQQLSYNLMDTERIFEGERTKYTGDNTGVSIIRDPEKCIKCKRCVRVCSEIQGIDNLQQMYRGVSCLIAPAFEDRMDDSVCIKCGQCINVCPTAALQEHSDIDKVWEALENPDKYVVVQTAPAIRAAIGEGWGIASDDPTVTGKLVSSLKKLGFDAIFDTNFTADLTIVEEATELINRIKEGKHLPLITSCSPGWINFLEHFYPEMIPNTSSCKSPMQMLSTMTKTYYAEKMGIPPEKIFVVAIMPCTAKKFEAKRPEHQNEQGIPYTDVSLTTRELISMIKSFGIEFNTLRESFYDDPFGESSGAGDIFATTGGVMEAALRTAVETITGIELKEVEFKQVRAVEGLRETTLSVAGLELNVAVANGLNNAKKILNEVKRGEKQYHIIEIMACPGGCISGGGQPYFTNKHTFPLDPEIINARRRALYTIDKNKQVRKSHDNPAIKKVYAEFLGKPGSHKAHKLLHTTYSPKFPKGILVGDK